MVTYIYIWLKWNKKWHHLCLFPKKTAKPTKTIRCCVASVICNEKYGYAWDAPLTKKLVCTWQQKNKIPLEVNVPKALSWQKVAAACYNIIFQPTQIYQELMTPKSPSGCAIRQSGQQTYIVHQPAKSQLSQPAIRQDSRWKRRLRISFSMWWYCLSCARRFVWPTPTSIGILSLIRLKLTWSSATKKRLVDKTNVAFWPFRSGWSNI